jgi:hypothetical protein
MHGRTFTNREAQDDSWGMLFFSTYISMLPPWSILGRHWQRRK